jgi:hypothetical protein
LVLARLKSTNASSDIVENGGRGVPLKSLKNVLASVATIHSLAVKDVPKDLTNENRVHVERAGSGK